jgi:hypothetical protein
MAVTGQALDAFLQLGAVDAALHVNDADGQRAAKMDIADQYRFMQLRNESILGQFAEGRKALPDVARLA